MKIVNLPILDRSPFRKIHFDKQKHKVWPMYWKCKQKERCGFVPDDEWIPRHRRPILHNPSRLTPISYDEILEYQMVKSINLSSSVVKYMYTSKHFYFVDIYIINTCWRIIFVFTSIYNQLQQRVQLVLQFTNCKDFALCSSL